MAALFRLKKTELFSVHELNTEAKPNPKYKRPNTSNFKACEDSASVPDLSNAVVCTGGTAQLWQFDKSFFPSASDGADNTSKDESLSEASASIIRQIEESKAKATSLPNDTIEVSFHCYMSRNSGLQCLIPIRTQLVVSRGLANVSILV